MAMLGERSDMPAETCCRAMSQAQQHTFMTTAMRAMRSAACWRILALLLLRRHLMVPQIWGRYGLARIFRLLTTVPKPFSITLASSLTCTAVDEVQPLQYNAIAKISVALSGWHNTEALEITPRKRSTSGVDKAIL